LQSGGGAGGSGNRILRSCTCIHQFHFSGTAGTFITAPQDNGETWDGS
jgi:hypothetical protein